MGKQIGFDFFNAEPVYTEQPDGTWERDWWEEAELATYLATAQAQLEKVPLAVRELYRIGASAGKDQVPLRDVSGEQEELFAALCSELSKAATSNLEVKCRKKHQTTIVGLHVPDVGTIVMYRWHTGDSHLQYIAGRDAFFLPSYLDEISAHFAPYSTWRKAYSADVIAYSNKGVATVKTFDFGGRLYIVTGIIYNRDYAECDAWTFCRLEDWKGPTYTYESQGAAVNAGRIERGDRRGLIVNVRGEKVVIDSAAIFYDKTGSSNIVDLTDNDEETDSRYGSSFREELDKFEEEEEEETEAA